MNFKKQIAGSSGKELREWRKTAAPEVKDWIDYELDMRDDARNRAENYAGWGF